MGVNYSQVMKSVIGFYSINSTVVLRRKSNPVRNDYGDITYTNSDEIIVCGVNDLNGDEDFVSEGIFNPGDKLFFIDTDTDEPSEGDEVIYNSKTYRIKNIRSPDSGTVSHYECWSGVI